MEIFIILLVVAFGFYISNSDEKNSEPQKEIRKIQPEIKYEPLKPKKFVKVIFKKGDRKRYDYFLGDNFDIEVGDFVEVWATSKFTGQNELKIVKVVYISKSDEISYKATKTIVGKSERNGW